MSCKAGLCSSISISGVYCLLLGGTPSGDICYSLDLRRVQLVRREVRLCYSPSFRNVSCIWKDAVTILVTVLFCLVSAGESVASAWLNN